MNTSRPPESRQSLFGRLAEANTEFSRRYPGEAGRRQPVHTVYGGAHLFKADAATKLGNLALRALEQFAPDFATFANAIGLPGCDALSSSAEELAGLQTSFEKDPAVLKHVNRPAWLALTVYHRVKLKLLREPVEDYRIDFEDGYGNRPSAEEDSHAESAAQEVADGMRLDSLPPYLGIRIKPLNEEFRARSVRTLDVFLTTLTIQTRGALPSNFVITLPKVTIPEQVEFLSTLLDLLEARLKLAAGALKLEIMIETTQAIIDSRGRSALAGLHDAARGRCTGAHFGTYDYTASCGVTAAHQQMTHPVCDFAKNMMQVAFAGTGIWLSDGATNVVPAPPHPAAEAGRHLSVQQEEENRAAVHRAWKLHYDHVQHSLINAYYQGWDLHPAQLPTRYAAVYTFFLEGLETAAERLRNFIEKAARATLVGDVFDDAATGQGLLNYFLRAINCGALTEEETLDLTSLTLDELHSRSFAKILKQRQALR